MLFRNAGKNDANEGKWLGIGGKFEEGETPDECMLREVREETGLELTDWFFHGVVHFRSDRWEDEDMYLYSAKAFQGAVCQTCNEGRLEWIDEKDVLYLNLWEGDRVFLERMLGGRDDGQFELFLRYEGEKLAESSEVISVERMRESDRHTIETKVPSKELMWRAGCGIFDAHSWKGPVAIVCGSGNNAGDGYVVALKLYEAGIPCTIITLKDRFSEDGQYYFDKCMAAGIMQKQYSPDMDFSEHAEILDCILGTGFKGDVRGTAAKAIEKINEAGVGGSENGGAYIISADINSGLDGDTGLASLCVKSDLTVSIGYIKTGLVNGDAGRYMKKLVNCDIGIELI